MRLGFSLRNNANKTRLGRRDAVLERISMSEIKISGAMNFLLSGWMS
jgi:hypothetical protein